MPSSFTIEETTIELHNLKFHAHHGVLSEERLLGNTFTVDVALEADVKHAMETDELCGTINYAEAYEVIKHEMEIPSQLLEHVCNRICSALFLHFTTLERARITIIKDNPPIKDAGTCQSAFTLLAKREKSM